MYVNLTKTWIITGNNSIILHTPSYETVDYIFHAEIGGYMFGVLQDNGHHIDVGKFMSNFYV